MNEVFVGVGNAFGFVDLQLKSRLPSCNQPTVYGIFSGIICPRVKHAVACRHTNECLHFACIQACIKL